jgi:hypothetical protein
MKTRRLLLGALLAGAVLLWAASSLCSFYLLSGLDLTLVARCPTPVL